MNNIIPIIIKILVLAGAIYHTFICFGSLIAKKQTIPGMNILLMSLGISGFIACQFWV